MKAILSLFLCLSLALTACSSQGSQEVVYDTAVSTQEITQVEHDVAEPSIAQDTTETEEADTPSLVDYDAYLADLNGLFSAYGLTASLDDTAVVALDDSAVTQTIKIYDTNSNGTFFIGTVEDDHSLQMVSVCWLGWDLSTEAQIAYDMATFQRYATACTLCLNETISEAEMQAVWTELNAMSATSTTPTLSDATDTIVMQLNVSSAHCISFVALSGDVENDEALCATIEELAYISFTDKLNESLERAPVESAPTNTTTTIQTEEELRLFLSKFFDNYYRDYITMSNTFTVQWLNLISTHYFNDEMTSDAGIQSLEEFSLLCDRYIALLSYFEDVVLSEEVGALQWAGNRFSYMIKEIDYELSRQALWITHLLAMCEENEVPFNVIFEQSSACPEMDDDVYNYLIWCWEFAS